MTKYSIETVFKAIDRISAPMRKMQSRMKRFSNAGVRAFKNLDRAAGKVLRTFSKIGKTAFKGVAIAGGLAATAIGLLVREFSKVENAQAAFTPLLGGVDKARIAVEKLNETAASTPFQFETLAGAMSQLLPVMNGDIDNTIKTIRMMGDAAGGNAQKLESITRGYTKAMLKGKVDMESLNMIAEAGVPIFSELADSMGTKTGEKFFKQISAGKVTTEQLTKAFEKMTGEGGIFSGGMEIASRTTTGLFSTLKDNVSLTAAAIGGALAPAVKELIQDATRIAKKVRAWAIANKDLIQQKFTKFVKELKKNLKQLFTEFQKLNQEHSFVDRVIEFMVAIKDSIVFFSKYGAMIGKMVAALIGVSLVIKATTLAVGILGVAFNTAFWPIAALAGAAALIIANWEPLKAFFANLWDAIGGTIFAAIENINAAIDAMFAKLDRLSQLNRDFGPGKIGTTLSEGAFNAVQGVKSAFMSDEERQAITPGIVTPSERVSKTISETVNKSSAEVTIKDDTGRAQVTGGKLTNNIKLQPSGAF